MTFFDRIQWSLEQAAKDAKTLPDPIQQEIHLQLYLRDQDECGMIVQLRAHWLKGVETIAADSIRRNK